MDVIGDESLLDDGDEHVDRECNPDLGFDGVLGGAEEDFDMKMLLDPFVKQLDLPPATIKLGDGERQEEDDEETSNDRIG